MSVSHESTVSVPTFTSISELVDWVVQENNCHTRDNFDNDPSMAAFRRVAWPANGRLIIRVRDLPTGDGDRSRIQQAVRDRLEKQDNDGFMPLPVKRVIIESDKLTVVADPARVSHMQPWPGHENPA